MDTLTLIQISDLHMPRLIGEPSNIDWKDKGFPKQLGQIIVTPRWQSVMRELIDYIENNRHSIGGIIICGDLTDKGDLSGYENCLTYLNETLQIADEQRWQKNQVHIVPGNHDINRKTNDSNSGDIYLKFEPLIMAWHNLGLPILTTRGARQTQMSANGNSVDVFSINSCIGCGEKRYMPAEIKEQMHEMLRTNNESNLIWEQLDTPAFSEDDINKIIAKIDQLSGLSVGVVVAHHNLLPQVSPRLEIYTEVINGGLVRSRLSQCKHPVIYCHGHVHEDPIEVVFNARSRRSRLISIACSKFTDGFNIIKLHFSRHEVK